MQLPWLSTALQAGTTRPSFALLFRKYWYAVCVVPFQTLPSGLNSIARRGSYSS